MSYYAWSGHEHHANVTQTARAMSLLYALTGSFDRPGGNVLFAAPPAAPIAGQDLPSARHMAPAVGRAERPLGPARWGCVATPDLYRAILEGTPYPVRAVIGFGANMLLAHADGRHGREALKALDFYAHADLFMNPTAELADVVLPVASAFEREGLKLGFEISQEAQSLIQLRPAVVPPPGEARPDTDIIFDLAARLGLAAQFWHGDIEAAYRHQLAPTGVTLEQLRAAPGGVRVPLQTRHAKHAEPDANGAPRGFATPSRKVELYSQTFLDHGYAPLPEFVGAANRPRGAARPGGALPADPDEREIVAVLPDPAPRAAEPAQARPASRSGAASRGGAGAGDRQWRLGVDRDARGQRARARPAQRGTRSARGGRRARLVAGAAPSSARPATTRSGRRAPTSTCSSAPPALDPVSGTASHRSYLCEIRLLAEEDGSRPMLPIGGSAARAAQQHVPTDRGSARGGRSTPRSSPREEDHG